MRTRSSKYVRRRISVQMSMVELLVFNRSIARGSTSVRGHDASVVGKRGLRGVVQERGQPPMSRLSREIRLFVARLASIALKKPSLALHFCNIGKLKKSLA